MRMQLDGTPQQRFRPCRVALPAANGGQVQQRHEAVRLLLEPGLETRRSLGKPAARKIRVAQIVSCEGVVRLLRQRLLKTSDGVGKRSLRFERVAIVVQGVHAVGIQAERRLVLGNGLVSLSSRLQI